MFGGGAFSGAYKETRETYRARGTGVFLIPMELVEILMEDS
jgi:hypothetical protein